MALETITYNDLLKERNRCQQLKMPKAVIDATNVVLLPAFLYGIEDHVDVAQFHKYHKWMRWKVFKQKGFACIYCGLIGTHAVLWEEENWVADVIQGHCDLVHIGEDGKRILLTLDHFVPRSKGGSNRIENLYPACYICNHVKKDKILIDFSLPS